MMIKCCRQMAPLVCALSLACFSAQNVQAMTSVNASVTMPIIVLSITTMPAKANLKVGQQLHYIAMGQYSDDTKRDITLLVHWSSSNAVVASVDNTGVVSALSAGDATINASLMTVNGQSIAHVS